MNDTATGQERSVEVAGLTIKYREGGTGEPLLVVHHDIGNNGWSLFYEALAGTFRVIVPELPGFGVSDRPAWARHPRDLAILLNMLLDKLDVDRATLVGLGFGGWIAAEMATMNGRRLSRLVLVNPMGIKPSEGEIVDQMMIDLADYAETGCANRESYTALFGDEVSSAQRLVWDYAREMTARVTWKPYMFSHQLPHLLGGVETPTLIAWGSDNRVVPRVCGEAYARALPNARLETVEGAGMWADLEQPDALAEMVRGHAAQG